MSFIFDLKNSFFIFILFFSAAAQAAIFVDEDFGPGTAFGATLPNGTAYLYQDSGQPEVVNNGIRMSFFDAMTVNDEFRITDNAGNYVVGRRYQFSFDYYRENHLLNNGDAKSFRFYIIPTGNGWDLRHDVTISLDPLSVSSSVSEIVTYRGSFVASQTGNRFLFLDLSDSSSTNASIVIDNIFVEDSDMDGDGIPDYSDPYPGDFDQDGDGVLNVIDIDDDNDGILDIIEGETDDDGSRR